MPVGAYAGASDTGRRRRRNEDNYVVAPPLFAVADGMGGAQAGEVASQLAASALEAGDSDAQEGTKRIDELIQEANRRIFDRASTDPSASGMGTTMTVALVEGMTVAIGHVGDSRAYLVRGEQMEQLTEDHSLVNELVKSGKLSEEEAQVHPQRSVITRAVGTDPDVDVDGFTIEAEEGDVFLICSDGLTDMVEDEEILELLHREPRRPRQGREGTRRGREPRRRRGQHHGGRFPDLVGGRAEPRGHGRDAGAHRGGGRARRADARVRRA